MTWNTPLGDRKLEGEERDVIKAALYQMTNEIIRSVDEDSLYVGISVFDSLSGCQQLVMLDYVRRYLLDDTPDTNPSTAVVEGCVAGVMAFIWQQIQFELDIDRECKSDSGIRPIRGWRKRIIRLIRYVSWEIDWKKGEAKWELAMERFHDRILHNEFYLFEYADDPPEITERLSNSLSIPGDYFRSIAAPEPDGPEMVELIRRLLSY